MKIEYFDTIDSTNLEAKRRFSFLKRKEFDNLHKTVLVAKTQTLGRGRLDRKFYSPPNSGLYFSAIYCKKNIIHPGIITATAGVSVCRAIKSVFDVDAKIKWVNDILIDDKKVSGILTEGILNPETKTVDAAIIGIGINLYKNDKIPSDLKDKIGAIMADDGYFDSDAVTSQKTIAEDFFKTILENLFNELDSENISAIIDEYKSRSIVLGKKITFRKIAKNESFSCTAIDITENGELVVRLENGEKKVLDSGEVTMHF